MRRSIFFQVLLLLSRVTFSELKKELFESVDFYVERAKADGDVYPEVLNQEYEFEYKFDVESLLFFYEKILSKAALERLTENKSKAT